MKKVIQLLTSLLIVMMSIVPIYAIEIPPSTDAYYLDEANVLSSSTEEYISDKNYDMDRHCGAYIEVVTEKYINCDVADYTYKIQNDWKISDNGFTLVLVTEEEKYYLMWGREIEKKLEPYIFQEIMETYFEPEFDAGNYDQAVRNAYDAIYGELVKLYGNPSKVNPDILYEFGDVFTKIGVVITFVVVILVIVIVLALLSKLRRNRYYSGYSRPYRSSRIFHSRGFHSSSGRSSSFSGSHHSSSFRSSSSSHHSSGGRSHGSGGRGAGVGRR